MRSTFIKNIARNLPYLKQVFRHKDRLKARVEALAAEKDRLAAEIERLSKVWVTYEPELMPSPEAMRHEGIEVLEDWFRWGEEWSMLLRVYGRITKNSAVLEIDCGLGRTAFPLRYVLSSKGTYDGFDVCLDKVLFLKKTFQKAHPNFRFVWANIHNNWCNQNAQVHAIDYCFPYPNHLFDIVYAASVFTHLMPETAQHYLGQISRVLKPGGRCLLSLFVLDYYRPGQPRPLGFGRPQFDFEHYTTQYGEDLAVSQPGNSEPMAAYRLNLIEHLVERAGLRLAEPPVPGLWSGSTSTWVGTQDLIILGKSPE